MARYRRAKSKIGSASFFAAIILLTFVGFMISFFPDVNNISNFLLSIAPYLVGVIIVSGLGLAFYMQWKEARRISALEIADIDKMTGVEFEQYVGEILKHQGYKIQFTPATGDYGTDIVASKKDETISVQLKRYAKKVGPEAIQQAVASMIVYKATKSMVVTSNYFTKEAKSLAEYNNCELVDRDTFADWIIEFKNK